MAARPRMREVALIRVFRSIRKRASCGVLKMPQRKLMTNVTDASLSASVACDANSAGTLNRLMMFPAKIIKSAAIGTDVQSEMNAAVRTTRASFSRSPSA